MQLAERVLVHQVHPAKICADITASVISDVLLWKAKPRAAIAVRIVLPLASSAAVLTLADIDQLAGTRQGQYVLRHMPSAAQAVRLAGDAVMGFGARRRSPALLLLGAAIITAGWSHAAWPLTSGHG
ncbi:MAG: hypothetical protein ACLQFR_07530 [Streptosporangiaceae bacterium]